MTVMTQRQLTMRHNYNDKRPAERAILELLDSLWEQPSVTGAYETSETSCRLHDKRHSKLQDSSGSFSGDMQIASYSVSCSDTFSSRPTSGANMQRYEFSGQRFVSSRLCVKVR